MWRGEAIDGRELSGLIQQMAPEYPHPLPRGGAAQPDRAQHRAGLHRQELQCRLDGEDAGRGSDRDGQRHGLAWAISRSNSPATRTSRSSSWARTGRGRPDCRESPSDIAIGVDATSLIFLHAAARPATNKESFRLIYDQEDTADLLGWYEVVYADGFVTTIPIRYGVNIQEWNWAARTSARDYCYGADAVRAGRSGRKGRHVLCLRMEKSTPGPDHRERAPQGNHRFPRRRFRFHQRLRPGHPE